MANLRKSLTTAERIRTNCKWPRSYHQKWTGFAVLQNTKGVHHDRPNRPGLKESQNPLETTWPLHCHHANNPHTLQETHSHPKRHPRCGHHLDNTGAIGNYSFALENTYKHKFSNNNMKKKQLIVKYDNLYTCVWIKNTLRVTCISKYSVHNFHYNIYIYICLYHVAPVFEIVKGALWSLKQLLNLDPNHWSFGGDLASKQVVRQGQKSKNSHNTWKGGDAAIYVKRGFWDILGTWTPIQTNT